ncbi:MULTISPECIES: acetylglutamate kinase [Slackia]|uniref:acetylglutamate kinase n=1 Tax=Slackia TaxID=84108 RepID=UPI00027C6687|nr:MULTISPECIES: acetylglutamate kinase [Slackia]EJU33283.1 acetylglutamate kinase [Slackia sp. CM382]MCQ5092117.1 acetylglutamate kinase [Slackia exigua]
MQYAKDIDRAGGEERAHTLIQGLPWIKSATGKTIVIKYGGAAMENAELMTSVMTDILLLKLIGVNPVIVHGGGKAINRMLAALGIESVFEGGLRVTDDATMDIVQMVLKGQVNSQLVNELNLHGNIAVGMCGNDAGTLKAIPISPELGRVGRIVEVDTRHVEDLIEGNYIPIIASLAAAADPHDEGVFNINADVAAGEIAAAIHAHKIIFLTDVDGLYENYPDPGSLIASMTQEDVEGLIDSGKLASGMIPKIRACTHALGEGIPRAHIINGTIPHALLLELLTDQGIGTMIARSDNADDAKLKRHALAGIATRLIENLPKE